MLQLRVFGTAPAMATVADRLQQIPGSRHVLAGCLTLLVQRALESHVACR